MWYLYGSRRGARLTLAATFDSEAQLLAYVRWATLESHGEKKGKFEQGSALVGCQEWEKTSAPLGNDDPADVPHNPTPSML